MDSVTQVTSTGCMGRIMGSIMGVLFGIVMILISVVLLFWNEGRAVHMAQSLAEGKGAVISVAADKVDSQNEGKLVHMTDQANTTESLTDSEYNVTDHAIKLRRRVEMYQWKESSHSETRKKLGGGQETVTTYTYSREWDGEHLDSQRFHERQGHQNPPTMPPGQEFTAKQVTLGAFQLDAGLLGQMSTWQKVPVTADHIPPQLKGRARVDNGTFYLGANPAAPLIGDSRVIFEDVKPDVVSIVAVQRGSTFEPYHARAGGNTIELLAMGTHSADDMFKQEETSNSNLTWILRGVGFVVLLIGLNMLFGPLVAVADVVPFIGDVLGAGAFVVSLGIALAVALVTIAVAWIAYRPLVGIGLLVLGIGAVVGLKTTFGKRSG